MKIWFYFGLGCLLLGQPAEGEVTRQQLDRLLDTSVRSWRWHFGDAPGAERSDYDDSRWEPVDLGFKWWPHDSAGWFRVRVTVPATVGGMPIQGQPLRMKAAVDNAAQAYVNGVFQQSFEWGKGDFLLSDHARPGEVISIALHATNRPGSGSLISASLVNGSGEPLADALREFVRLTDDFLQDAADLPEAEGTRARSEVHEALQALKLDAYQAGQRDSFLASVEAARSRLFADRASLDQRLAKTSDNLAALKEKIRRESAAGRPVAYATADARVVESFLKYVRDDLAEKDPHRQLRGLKGAAYIERLCAAALQSGAESEPPFPRYRTGSCTIRDGGFWQADRPVFFTGVGHFGQVKQDISILNDYGLNIIQFEMGPQNGLPTPDAVDLEGIRQNVVRWLDQAAAQNVAVNLLISPHYFPGWAFDADPAHRQCGKDFIKFCIDAPNTRPVMDKWLDALMPLIARHPALHSICLSNEPQYQGRCGYERALFQKWLKERWGSIRQANATYGTHFRRFEEIELPRDASCYGLYFDRWRFNQERFLAFHEHLRDRVHRYDPALPVHTKVMAHAFEDPGQFEYGVDYERFTQLDRIAGNDCVMALADPHRGEYACDWQVMAMNYTLQHSAAPDSPIFNSENHLIGDGDQRYIPENYIRTVYWQEAIHGQGATTTWVWERGQDGDLAENILTRANCVHALGRVSLDLQRLGREVHALSRARSGLGIFYSYSSLLPSMDYFQEVRAAYEGAYFTGAVADFVSESQIAAGRLANYRVLVIPRATHVPTSVVKAMNAFIDQGGTIMTVGPCLDHDEYGRRQPAKLVQSGRGRWLQYPDSLTPRAYRDILDRVLERAGVARPVRLEGARGETVWGVNLRSVETPDGRLVHLLNLTREPHRVRLFVNSALTHAVNLIDGKPMEFPLTLPPLEPALLLVKSGK